MNSTEQRKNLLNPDQITEFWKSGVLVAENAVDDDLLARLRGQFARWVDESREYESAYGSCTDGRPRFDLEPGHSSERPALRRVNSPADVSADFLEAISASAMKDMVTDLIGPNVRHHHNKINSKLPGTATQVKWHQDFPFTPHSNTDLITALLMLDDVTLDNGPLRVLDGSHRGPLHSLWHDDRFTGAVDDQLSADMERQARSCCAPAGSVCLMHTCLAHGSAPNLSADPRTLFITVYAAADALPFSPSPVPGEHGGMLVSGTDPGTVRSTEYTLRLPELPAQASFFSQQAGLDR